MELETEGDGLVLDTALLCYRGHAGTVVVKHGVSGGVIQPGGEPVDLPAYVAALKDGNPEVERGFHWTDESTVAQGRDWVCWWRKAGYASIFINGERRKAWLPALCFVGGEYIRVWAIPDAKPTAKTTLRLTNWPNTYSNGGVCWGSGRVPTGLRPKDWEDAFLSSSFTSGESFKAKPHAITKYKSYGTLGYTLEALARPRH